MCCGTWEPRRRHKLEDKESKADNSKVRDSKVRDREVRDKEVRDSKVRDREIRDREIRVDRSTMNRSDTTGNRQRSRSASSRPQSATAVQRTRTSTGRPLDKEKTRGEHPAKGTQSRTVRPSNAVHTSGAKSNSGVKRSDSKTHSKTYKKNNKKKNNVRLNPKTVIPAAIILGILLALVITLIMRASLLKVHQISQDYNMGDTFDIKNFFEASSVDTYIECDSNDFVPDKLGKYKVKFTVRRGKLSSRKTAKINVVDEVNPYISGPDEIEVKVGQDINWSDYYTVTDADPDIQSKLTSVKDLDTGKARAVNATLTVTDWAGNTASKNITVVVTDGDVAN